MSDTEIGCAKKPKKETSVFTTEPSTRELELTHLKGSAAISM